MYNDIKPGDMIFPAPRTLDEALSQLVAYLADWEEGDEVTLNKEDVEALVKILTQVKLREATYV